MPREIAALVVTYAWDRKNLYLTSTFDPSPVPRFFLADFLAAFSVVLFLLEVGLCILSVRQLFLLPDDASTGGVSQWRFVTGLLLCFVFSPLYTEVLDSSCYNRRHRFKRFLLNLFLLRPLAEFADYVAIRRRDPVRPGIGPDLSDLLFSLRAHLFSLSLPLSVLQLHSFHAQPAGHATTPLAAAYVSGAGFTLAFTMGVNRSFACYLSCYRPIVRSLFVFAFSAATLCLRLSSLLVFSAGCSAWSWHTGGEAAAATILIGNALSAAFQAPSSSRRCSLEANKFERAFGWSFCSYLRIHHKTTIRRVMANLGVDAALSGVGVAMSRASASTAGIPVWALAALPPCQLVAVLTALVLLAATYHVQYERRFLCLDSMQGTLLGCMRGYPLRDSLFTQYTD